MPKLSVERLFSDPPLFADAPRKLQMAPGDGCITYLQAAPDDRERLDLWRADPATGEAECWVSGTDLAASLPATEAELAEKERRRAFVHGITNYQWHPDGQALLLIAEGGGYLLDAATDQIRQVTPEGQRYTDIKLSPQGRHLSYVGDGNLYIRNLADGSERAVAASDDPNLSFGIADFLAQEEMDRYDGHWWCDDESMIAFTSVDVSPVQPSHRFEANDQGPQVIEQRYPFAGEANPSVGLGLYDVATAATRWIDYADGPEDYLARVAFTEGELAVQVQNRAQNRLRLKLIDLISLSGRTLIEESSATWINLHDNFTPIGKDDYLWTSERSGTSQIYRYRNDGCEPVSQGQGHITRILAANSERALVCGWLETPTEQRLYRIELADGRHSRLTGPGWHELTTSQGGTWLFDRASTLQSPGHTQFGRGDGEWQPLAKTEINRQHPYHPFVDEHITPELGILTAEDGQTLHYSLTRPRWPTEPVPLIVHVYGGPGVQRVRNEWPPLPLQLFVQRGFGVLELDNRGSANRGRRFEAPIHRRLGQVEVRDQALGAEFAAGLPWVDARRIGVFGHSYGGYMALMCLAQVPERFRAGVAVAPVTDWRLYDTHYTERYLGHPKDNAEGYEASSALAHIDGIEGKLLLMHGLSDDNVVFTHSMRLMTALQKANIPFELMAYPGAKHSMQQKAVAIHRFTLILDFFERHLCE